VLERLQRPVPVRPAAAPRFRTPLLALAASLAAVALGTVVLWRAQRPPTLSEVARDVPEASALWSDSETVAKALEPLEARLAVRPAADGTRRFRPGDRLHLDVATSADAAFIVLLRTEAGPRLLYPAAGTAPLRAGGDGRLALEPAYRAPEVSGHYRLRLIAVRGAGVTDLASLQRRVGTGDAAVSDLDFDVASGGPSTN
jgi:hypothetical protein